MEKEPKVKEKSKGLSLRRKRGKGDKSNKPVIGPPRQVPMPPMPGARLGPSTANGGAPHGPPELQARDREKVADLVKRRMSTRFTMAPDQGIDAPAMPPMPPIPSIPSGPGAKLPQPGQRRPGPGVSIDIGAFKDPAFSPDKFVSTVLANASEDEIKEFQQRLADIKTRTESDLQKNVFVNRTQFIIISKEIDKLKTEMRILRTLLTDLHGTTGSLRTESSMSAAASDTKARKAANRSSVADLTALHMSHLQALWKEVEGAQKFLPSVPGRHIILESRNWIELNAATWKPRRMVHMVLLNDHLLIATVKKKRSDNSNASGNGKSSASPQIKNVAEKCWGLSEIEMINLTSDSQASRRGVTNAINLRVGKESFVYQVDNPEKKAELLRQFKKSADELRKALRAETEDTMRRRDSMQFLTGRDPKLLEHGDLLNSLSANGTGATVFTVDGQTRNLRWIETKLDELDENIAYRHFEQAVTSVVTMRSLAQGLGKNNALVSEFVYLKLDERASKLAGVITTDLVENPAQKSAVKANVQWLVKLDYEDRAREAFLEARSTMLKKRTRQVQFEGDVSLYISQVALVQFTLIKNTVEIYNSCFDYRLASALVRWAKDHIENYIDLLDRQLQAVDPSSKVFDDCMEITKIHSTMLVDCGLDFKELRNPPMKGKAHQSSAGLGVKK